MDRGSTTAFQTEIVKSANRPFHLVKLILDEGEHYLSDCDIPVTFDGNEYLPTGSFLSFSDIVESNETTIEQIAISLSGIDQTFNNLFLTVNYIDREVQIYKAFLNSSNALVSDPLLIFSGRLNNPTIKEDADQGTSTLSFTALQIMNRNKVILRVILGLDLAQ